MSLKELCKELDLNSYQCEVISGYVQKHSCGSGRSRQIVGKPRTRSKWQQCIAERRAGKSFDPQAIKELAREYKEGRCP